MIDTVRRAIGATSDAPADDDQPITPDDFPARCRACDRLMLSINAWHGHHQGCDADAGLSPVGIDSTPEATESITSSGWARRANPGEGVRR